MRPTSLSKALDLVYGYNWRNPIHPYFVSGIHQTPYEAYMKLNPEYKRLILRWLGHEPERGEE